MTVFEFTIYLLDKDGKIVDINETQKRYVVADTEKSAEAKLDNYRKQMIKDGYCDFAIIGCATVEIENVII